MKKYICLSECGTIAIYKSTTLPRLYRMSYPGKHKGMKLLTYKKESNALRVCKHTEEIGNGIFKQTPITV